MTYWPDHPSSGNQKQFEDDLKGRVSEVSFLIPSWAEKLNERRGFASFYGFDRLWMANLSAPVL
jgi:hypothetical protein